MPLNLTNEVDKFLEIHNLPEQREEEIENFNSPLSQSICISKNTTRKVQAQRVSLVNQIFKNINLTPTQRTKIRRDPYQPDIEYLQRNNC